MWHSRWQAAPFPGKMSTDVCFDHAEAASRTNQRLTEAALLEQKAELFSRFQQEMYPLFEAGTLRPLIYATYELADALRAQDTMALDQHLGKIILHP